MTDAATATTEPAPSNEPYYADDAPPCFCKPPVPWEERRYQGTWEGCELRTCEVCIASLTRLVTA